MKKYNNFVKLTLVTILVLSFFVGCGGSEKLPKIVSVTFQENSKRIIVEATDDVKVTGYLITDKNDEPKLDDELWQESGLFDKINIAGTIYVWVKDEDKNLARSEIVIEDQLAVLARDYEFLQWYLEDSTTKVVDGVTYDLVALRQEYGELYRFVEPLSKDEVEFRFQYLAEYFSEQAKNGIYEDYAGGISHPGDEFSDKFVRSRIKYYEDMGRTSDEKLLKYKHYYIFSDKIGRYAKVLGGTFTSLNDYTEMIEYINQFSFDEKDWYIRQYMIEVDMLLNSLESLNVKPLFDIKPKD